MWLIRRMVNSNDMDPYKFAADAITADRRFFIEILIINYSKYVYQFLHLSARKPILRYILIIQYLNGSVKI